LYCAICSVSVLARQSVHLSSVSCRSPARFSLPLKLDHFSPTTRLPELGGEGGGSRGIAVCYCGPGPGVSFQTYDGFGGGIVVVNRAVRVKIKGEGVGGDGSFCRSVHNSLAACLILGTSGLSTTLEH